MMVFFVVAGCVSGAPQKSDVDTKLRTNENSIDYPRHWFAPVVDPNPPAWELLPQTAGPGEVILSKRNELGLLSNFAQTPFVLDGVRYASVEGFWQMMLYPEGPSDPRNALGTAAWPFSRSQVSKMIGFEAKRAGKTAEQNLQKMGLNWVSYRGQRFEYRTPQKAEHYRWIRRAMVEKLKQNPQVYRILMATRKLSLKPDHHPEPDAPPAWRYEQIWMELREALQSGILLEQLR